MRRLLIVIFFLTIGASFFSSNVFGEEQEVMGNINDLGEESISDKVIRRPKKSREKTVELSMVGRIDPFKDIAVLQKRFLPKRRRYEASASLGFLADNPFFVTSVIYGRIGYYFSEMYGIEGSFFKSSTSSSKVTDNLLDKANVSASTSSAPSSYYGADLKLTPIYGKVSFWNKSIIPFDNYYLIGVGQTSITGGESAVTLHGATGFSFALRKWLALRAELGFYSYSSETRGSFLDTHINIGASMYFPKANYR